MDQGIQIIWYDLPENKKFDYLNWLHSEHLPSILTQSDILWAAHYKIIKTDKTIQRLSKFVGRPEDSEDIPLGSDFVTLIGAVSPNVFFRSNFHSLGTQDPKIIEMFSHRIGTRVVVTTEQARVNGPEVLQRLPDTTPGPFIQLGHFRVRSLEEEFDLNTWYTEYRLPAIAKMPGAIAARKLVTVAGWVKHVVLYEFISAEARHTNFMDHEKLAFTDGEWTNKVVKYTAHAPGSPSIGERIWPNI